MTRAVVAILAVLVLSGCSGIFAGPPVEQREPDGMRQGSGLLSGTDGNLSVEL